LTEIDSQIILTERSFSYNNLNSKEKILIKAKSLFAKKGFADVSMRNLAHAVNMSVAALYHYFPDKNRLYLEAVQYAFADKVEAFSSIWQDDRSAEIKLELFVGTLIHELTLDQEFHKLILREIVDANPERMKMLANDVFKQEFCFLLAIMKEIAPEKDAHLSAISVLSLCKHHLEMQPLRQHLPGWKQEHEQADVLAKHIMKLLLNGL
jgi:AcrR family transcriptional regulator